MDRIELNTYQKKLAAGKKNSHREGASRSFPQGFEYQRGTSVGRAFQEKRSIMIVKHIHTIVNMLEYLIIVFL